MIRRRRCRWGGQLWEGQLGSRVPAVECGQHPPQRWWRAPGRHWNEPWRPRGPGGQRQRATQLPEASRWHHQCNFHTYFQNKLLNWPALHLQTPLLFQQLQAELEAARDATVPEGNLERIAAENKKEGRDKFKTLREIRSGFAKRRIDTFENMWSDACSNDILEKK